MGDLGESASPRNAPKHWFLAQLKPNAWRTAEENLRRQGFAVFNPLEEHTLVRRGRFVVEHRQLFPGYLFISFDLAAAPWRAVNSTYGVVRLVSFEARRPQIVPADLVEEIMARCGAEGRPIPHAVLECGDSVRFTIGPFADLVATVESVSPEKRIWVMLEALGRKTRVLAEQAAVKRVCPV